MFLCWSVKGGCGTTVVAASLALVLSASHDSLVVDLAGDIPAVLGMAEPSGPGVTDWLASTSAGAAALHALAIDVAPGLRCIPRGAGGSSPTVRWNDLVECLGQHRVVVDAGTQPPPALLAAADRSLLVVRSCYLALRRVAQLHVPPTGVVLMKEPGRVLQRADVESAAGAPVVAEVPYDPQVSRSVDSGLLAGRLPHALRTALRTFA